METESGLRSISRRCEGAKERRERRLRAEARIKLQPCRDAVRIASHHGGDGCRRAHTDASTQTAVTEYVTPALAVLHVGIRVCLTRTCNSVHRRFTSSL